MPTFTQFKEIDLRVGVIVEAEQLPNPSYVTHRVVIDFGKEIGIKVSLANLRKYSLADLKGKLVVAIINLPVKQIGELFSEVLLLGAPDKEGQCVLIQPDKEVNVGSEVF
ncbi:MAG TPA: tRNA-binding protein [Patescibacteria group bacterium]|nr:tRNA-binding protein [Patescibacteria group bacterium]